MSIDPTNPEERRREGGFSLVELAVTLSVFVLLASGMAASLAANSSLNRTTQQVDLAREVARGQMEEILAWEDFTTASGIFGGQRFVVGDLTAPDGGLPGLVSIDASDPDFLHVTVQVTWVGERGAETVALRTQMADVHPQ